jgi:hypothetical protein
MKSSAGTGTLLLKVEDLDRAASTYLRLGLRPLRRSRGLLILELPCGVHLVLFRPWGGPRPSYGC